MSQPDQAPAVKEEAGKIKLLQGTKRLASGKQTAVVDRIPEEISIRLSERKTLTIENLALNASEIEVRLPKQALGLFASHPLKKRVSADPEEGESHVVHLPPGQSAVFRLSGKTGEFKFKTIPPRRSGAHHDDVHIEC